MKPDELLVAAEALAKMFQYIFAGSVEARLLVRHHVVGVDNLRGLLALL